jgi:2-polyprenyl-3-methyl-5-hydroxy-6-metoxy-1,4-benzoquinol methylase
MLKTLIFILKKRYFLDIEDDTAFRFCKRLLTCENDSTLRLIEISNNNRFTVKDISAYGDFEVCLFINGIVFITYESVKRLSEIAIRQDEVSFIVPVSNESRLSAQKYAPQYLYQTISVFKWIVDDIYKRFKDEIIEVDEIDNFCFVSTKHALGNFSPDVPVFDLVMEANRMGLRYGVAKGIYVHRYGNVYESRREDLIAYVPNDSKVILDIGCAKGFLGELLKRRQDCFVTGVEYSYGLIDDAKKRLDRVIVGDIEKVVKNNELDVYDCIICGDVLEHLNDPWSLVKSLKGYLKKSGIFIASVPNVNNWAIIYEMLLGRWDYVPFSILSGTHIRFFTRRTFIEMFIDAGYSVENVFFQSIGVHPKGEEFIKKISKLETSVNKEELQASEIVVIARNV